MRSAVVILLSSLIMDMAQPLLPAFRGERLLAAICGGLLSGVGIGVILLRGASTGGSDIVAGLLRRRYAHISVGRLILLSDAAVIVLSVIVFGEFETALYAGLQVFVTSLLIDHIVYGREEGRLLLVVSRYPSILTQAILAELSRGVTVIPATGGYTGNDTAVLLCAVEHAQLAALKDIVHECDPAAFTMVVVTEQVMGHGFSRYDLL